MLHEPRGEELEAAILEGLAAHAMPFERLSTSEIPVKRADEMMLLDIQLR